MDSFTERMMERAKKRKDRLRSQLKCTVIDPVSQSKVSPSKESTFIDIPKNISSLGKKDCNFSHIKRTEENFSAEEIIPVNSKPLAESVRHALIANQSEDSKEPSKNTPFSSEEECLLITKTSSMKKASSLNKVSFPIKENLNPSRVTHTLVSASDKCSNNITSSKIGSVLQKASLYEGVKSPSKPVEAKDPAELSVAERKALFEKNKGCAIVPKVPFGQPLPASKSVSAKVFASSQNKVIIKQISAAVPNISMAKPENVNLSDQSIGSEANANNEILLENSSQSEKDISYSSIACSEKSLGREIVRMAQEKSKAIENRKRQIEKDDPFRTENEAYIYDELQNESISRKPFYGPSPCKQFHSSESLKSECETDATHAELEEPKKFKTDQDYNFSSNYDYVNNNQQLLHSISLYRKSQTENEGSSQNSAMHALKKIVHQSNELVRFRNSEIDEKSELEAVANKITELEQKISAETMIISQATQALNLCCSTVEFTDSPEQIEAERLLLLANQRKQAALNEIQRLKVEGTLKPNKPSSNFLTDQGSLTVSDITLPVKLDAIRAATREEKCHNFVCLLKYNEVVLGTSLIAAAGKNLQEASNGIAFLRFSNVITFPKLYSDFKITVEIYHVLTPCKENLPHDVKYRISSKKDCNKLKMTPKKRKSNSKLLPSGVPSPVGTPSVKTSKFSLVGYIVFSLREVKRTQFTLNKVVHSSPLDGKVQLKLSCELSPSIEHCGFLTMFEDVSGFGAWHRRWCSLKGDSLSYWKYPDDERIKVPINTIDLNTCTAQNIGAVSRDICARPNTFLLETIRPARDDDVDSLVLVRHAAHTMVRYLLSTDTKEERIEWCSVLNKALALLHTWRRK